MKQKEKVQISPHPDKILIKVSKASWNSLFSKYITVKGGKKVELFTDIEETEGFEGRFRQNVSVGIIVAIGKNITHILPGDVAIIDYAVTGNDDALVGFVKEDRIISIDAVTTYHKENSVPNLNGRHAYVEGDYDNLSRLLGVVRMGKLMALSPYVFLQHEPASKLAVSKEGLLHVKQDGICKRKVLSADKDCIAKEGDTILIRETDLFSRIVDKKEISVIFDRDVLAVP